MPKLIYAKFLVALTAAAGVAASFLADGELSLNDILGIITAAIGALGVYAVPNKPIPGTPAAAAAPGRDEGQSSVALICIVIVAVLVAWLIIRALQ